MEHKNFTINNEKLKLVLDYLRKRPYNEVADMLNGLLVPLKEEPEYELPWAKSENPERP